MSEHEQYKTILEVALRMVDKISEPQHIFCARFPSDFKSALEKAIEALNRDSSKSKCPIEFKWVETYSQPQVVIMVGGHSFAMFKHEIECELWYNVKEGKMTKEEFLKVGGNPDWLKELSE